MLSNTCPILLQKLNRAKAILVKVPKPQNKPTESDIYYYLSGVDILHRCNGFCPLTRRALANGYSIVELSKLYPNKWRALFVTGKNKLIEDNNKLAKITKHFKWQNKVASSPTNKKIGFAEIPIMGEREVGNLILLLIFMLGGTTVVYIHNNHREYFPSQTTICFGFLLAVIGVTALGLREVRNNPATFFQPANTNNNVAEEDELGLHNFPY